MAAASCDYAVFWLLSRAALTAHDKRLTDAALFYARQNVVYLWGRFAVAHIQF